MLNSYASFFVYSAINVLSVHQAGLNLRAWREIHYNSRTIRDLDQLSHTTASHYCFLPRTPSLLIEATKTRLHVVAYYFKLHTAAPLRFPIHMLAIVTPDVLACFPQWGRLHALSTATRHTILHRRYRLATIMQYIAFSSELHTCNYRSREGDRNWSLLHQSVIISTASLYVYGSLILECTLFPALATITDMVYIIIN